MGQEYLLKINGDVYYFKLNGRALSNLEKRYGADGSVAIINQIFLRINPELNFIKILACSCINQDVTEEFLLKNLVWNKQLLNIYTNITTSLFKGYSNGFKQAQEGLKLFIEELGKLDKEQQQAVLGLINKEL